MGKTPLPPEVELLREATREAHAAMKDMRRLLDECRGVLTEMHIAAQVEVDDLVMAHTDKALTQWSTETKDFIKEVETHVFARFDRMYQLLIDNLPKEKRNPEDPHLPGLLQQAGLIKPEVDLSDLLTPIGVATEVERFRDASRMRGVSEFREPKEEAEEVKGP